MEKQGFVRESNDNCQFSKSVISGEDMNSEDRFPWWLVVLTAIVVIVLWLLLGVFASSQKDPGQFGDMFGAANSLFSALAFLGLIIAILLQRQELQYQRKELIQTREELSGQRQQLEAQNATLKHQSLETTFFQLLRLQNEIIGSIDLRNNSKAVTALGRDCFSVFYSRFKGNWKNTVGKACGSPEDVDRVYLEFYRNHDSELGHYFRNLYNVVKFVDESELGNKRLYTNLIRAQLSTYEVQLLFYNALSEMGREKFKPLIERYALLKAFDLTQLAHPDHQSFYSGDAFK